MRAWWEGGSFMTMKVFHVVLSLSLSDVMLNIVHPIFKRQLFISPE